LSVVSKLLERIVFRQLMAYLSSADLPTLQSGCRLGRLTETAVLQVMSGLLDLTAAFDAFNYGILLQRLQQTLGVDGNAHWWFGSYLVSDAVH